MNTVKPFPSPGDTLDCGHVLAAQPEGSCGTGYAYDIQRRTKCYACCADEDRANMIATGKAMLYLTFTAEEHSSRNFEYPTISRGAGGGHSVSVPYITNWPGSLKIRAFPAVRRSSRGGGFGAPRVDVWFPGPDGFIWHAINRGDNDIVRCKRTKERF